MPSEKKVLLGKRLNKNTKEVMCFKSLAKVQWYVNSISETFWNKIHNNCKALKELSEVMLQYGFYTLTLVEDI